MFASPVPTQTISGFDGLIARSPMEVVNSSSKRDVQVTPSFSVFQTPPEAPAT